jgi:IS30 family transposase
MVVQHDGAAALAGAGCGYVGGARALPTSTNGPRIPTPEPKPVIGRATSTRLVLVLHERKSRVTLAATLTGKTAAETISVMLAAFARIEPALRKSITFDNDTAFAQRTLLRTMRAVTTWFCDVYASW